jgi:hypothetical protein
MVQRKTKTCLSCKHPWPLTAKYCHRNRSSPDGFQPKCKPCNTAMVREWQASHREQYLKTQRERGPRVNPLRAEVIEYKESHPCADCGVCYPYVAMSFDHPPGADKVDDVSRLAKASGHDRLMAEIEKCDLCCLNCHAIRTHERWLLEKAKTPDKPE